MHNAPRKPWDLYWLDIAAAVSTRATCPRAAVGCVLVQGKHLIACGYNGAPSGYEHCLEAGCRMIAGHCLRAVHAERNAIYQALHHGHSVKGATLFCTHQPCEDCTKDIIRYRIGRVVFATPYGDDVVIEMMKLGGIQVG